MKAKSFFCLIMVIITISFGNCGDKEEIVLCANRCPAATPWRVESLDLALPCFATQDTCLKWAARNGYTGKPCVKCD